MKRLLVTGAAGGMGQAVRPLLAPLAETIRLSDCVDLGNAAPHEELVTCDLTDRAAMRDLVAGCDGIVHLGGKSIEAPWDVIRDANIDGIYNLFEAARAAGAPRIALASSNHTVGYYPQNTRIDTTAPVRPDSLYGVSKVFAEAMASMYHDKFGIETACIRIGSCLPEPRDHRMLSTWLSPADFVRLLHAVFETPRLGCPVIFGVSNNDRVWWDNAQNGYIGWHPQDNAEVFRAKLDAAMPRPAPDSPNALYQGGMFTAEAIHED